MCIHHVARTPGPRFLWFPEGPERGSRAGAGQPVGGLCPGFNQRGSTGGLGQQRPHNPSGCTYPYIPLWPGLLCHWITQVPRRPHPRLWSLHPQASPRTPLISLLLPSPNPGPGPTGHLILSKRWQGRGSRTHVRSCPAPVPPTASSLVKNPENSIMLLTPTGPGY